MKDRCDRATAENDKELWEYCTIDEQCLEYPTFFITIAPLEWNFSLPAWLQRYKDAGRLSEVQGPLTLHIHRVIHSVTGRGYFHTRLRGTSPGDSIVFP